MGGAKILRSAGAKSASLWTTLDPDVWPWGVSFVVRGAECVTASRVAAALWGRASGAGDSPGGGVESGDETFSSTRRTLRSNDSLDDSMDVNQTAVEPPEALSLRFEKLATAPSQNSGIDDPNGSVVTPGRPGSGSSSLPRASPCSGRRCRRWCGR